MAKTRIHELAKDLKMDSKDLMKLLEKMGLPFKTVQSALEESDVERVKNQINLSRKEGIVEKRVKPTVIRRRVLKEEAAPPAPEPVSPAPPKEEVKPAAPPKRPKPETPTVVAEPAAELPKEKVEIKPEVLPPRPEEVKAPPEPIGAAPLPPTPAKPVKERVEEKKAEPSVDMKLAPGAEAPAKPKVVEQKAEGIPGVEKPVIPEKPEPVPLAKPKPPEKPPKQRKKAEPAKIIERAAVPPPSLVKEREHPPVEKKPGVPTTPHPPIILQRPAAPGAPKTFPTEEEKARRKKRVKKDVEVMEEGKPNRVRVITTKKRAFKEYDYLREERTTRPFVFKGEAGPRVVPKAKAAKPETTLPKAIKRKIRISEVIMVGELAKRMGIKASEVIKKLMELGLMVTINQAIDAEAASLVAADFGYEVEKTGLEIEDLKEEKEERAEDLSPAPRW